MAHGSAANAKTHNTTFADLLQLTVDSGGNGNTPRIRRTEKNPCLFSNVSSIIETRYDFHLKYIRKLVFSSWNSIGFVLMKSGEIRQDETRNWSCGVVRSQKVFIEIKVRVIWMIWCYKQNESQGQICSLPSQNATGGYSKVPEIPSGKSERRFIQSTGIVSFFIEIIN